MKAFGTIVILLVLSFNVFAQKLTPKAIEDDLLKSYKKIGYWKELTHDTTKNIISVSDSLEKANDAFGSKLKYYTSKSPSTLTQHFNRFKHETLSIINSNDGLLRIYGWSTEMGGAMVDFDNVIQYKSGHNSASIFQKDTITTSDSGYIYQYDHIYTLTANKRTYYLATYYGVFGSWSLSRGIQIFCISDGKLNPDVKLIKTKTGFHSQLYYDSDYYSYVNWKMKPRITFDAASKSIKIPITTYMGKMTHSFINYKFIGKYFEKIN